MLLQRLYDVIKLLLPQLNELHALRDNDRIQRAAKVAREVEELAKAAGVNGEVRHHARPWISGIAIDESVRCSFGREYLGTAYCGRC
jgi:hypothetical protein